MQTPRFLCLLALLGFSIQVAGQSTTPNSREPEKRRVFYAPRDVKVSKVRRSKVTHTARYEFYERIEKAAREKKKIVKRLSKAQFSDPRYFGHKRIPRRKSFFKMRYCDECGIRH